MLKRTLSRYLSLSKGTLCLLRQAQVRVACGMSIIVWYHPKVEVNLVYTNG